MARRRAGHYLQGSRTSLLSAQSYLFRDYRLVVSVLLPGSPGESRAWRSCCCCATGSGPRCTPGFPSRSWTAEDLINWVSALLDPHRQTGDAIPLTYDDGRELRDQVIDRATRLRIDRQGIGLANPAADLQTELRLMSVRAFPPRFALWNAGSLIGDLYQGTLQYPCPFLLTLGVHVLDAEATRNWAFLKAARATTNATSYMARFCPTCRSARPTGTSCSKRWTTVSSSSTSTCSSRSSPSRRAR